MKNLKDAYLSLYGLVEAALEDHFVFTSSGAEAVNHVIFSAYLDVTRKTGKNHFISAATDEMPAIMAMRRLQEMNCVYQMAPVDNEGRITKQALAETLSPRTALVSVSWANALTGVIQPVSELAEVCKERGVLFHVEATHMLGKTATNLEETGADFLTFDGEALGGPPGTGGLFVHRKTELSPFILGGKEQGEMRAGSIPTTLFFDLADAAKAAREEQEQFALEAARLRLLFETLLLKEIPDARLLFQEGEKLPSVSVFLFPGIFSEALLFHLKQKKIPAQSGGGSFQQLKQLLKACGLTPPLIECGMSFSLSKDISQNDVKKWVTGIADSVKDLKKCSVLFMKEETWA